MTDGSGDDSRPRVLITRPIPVQLVRRLEALALLTLRLGPEAPSENELIELLPGHELCISMLTDPLGERVLQAAAAHPQHPLQLISQVAVGLDNVDLRAAASCGIQVSHTPGVLTDATADLTFALILASCRRIVEADRFVRDGQWRRWSLDLMTGVQLRGSRLGIIGLGRIGTAVARRALPFGMEIVYTGRRRAAPQLQQELSATFLPLDELLATSDVVALHAPLTPETRGLLGRKELMSMREGAVLVNTSRGALLDEEAIAEALEHGPLRAVGLDVYADEPRVHPSLLQRSDVVLLPHIGSATEATRLRMATMATEAAEAWLNSSPVPHLARIDG